MSDDGQAPKAPDAPQTPADAMFGSAQEGGQPPGDQAPPASPPPGDAPPAPANEGHWYGQADADTQAYLENKGWNSNEDMLKSYRSLESMRGVPEDRLLQLPADPNDAEAMSELYGKLGRPESADGYEIEGEGLDWIKEMSFDLGLNQQQAKGVLDRARSELQQVQEQHKVQSDAEYQNDLNDLKNEWGREYDANMGAAKKASMKYLDDGSGDRESIEAGVNKLVDALGAKTAFGMLAKIGRGLGEAKFIDGDGGSNQQPFGLTPDVAAAQRKALLGNPEFQQRMSSNDPNVLRAAQAELNALSQAAGL